MPTTDLTQAPPDVPTATTPTAPGDILPRTERYDWLFVGYPGATRKNDPPAALYVTDLAEIPRALDALDARDRALARYPYIFLAPALASAVEDAAGERALNTRDLVACWDEGCPDDACTNPAHRPSPAAWRSPLNFASLRDYVDPNSDDGSKAAEEASNRAFDAALEAVVATLPAADRALLRDHIADWWTALEERGRDGMTFHEWFIEDARWHLRSRLHAAEHFPGGWTIILDAGETYDANYQRLPTLRTPGGARFVKQQDYAALADRVTLPVAAKRLVGFVREYHDAHQPEDEYGCDKFPSDRAIAAWLRGEGITDPVPPTVRLGSAADLLADQDTRAVPPALLPYLAWRGRVTLLAAREKDGKSTLVASAVAALTRGAAWLGQPTTPTTVLWLYEEPDRDFKARLQRFGADLTRVFPLRLPLADVARDLAAAVAQVRPGLIVIDSLIRYQGGAVTQDTSGVQWERVMTPLATLAHAPDGPAILVLHHAGKRGGEYRDSTEIAAAADLLVQVPRGIERGNRQRLEAKGRIVGVEPYAITVELAGDAHRLATAAEPGAGRGRRPAATIAEKDRAVLAALAGTLSYSDWYAASGLTSKKTFDATVKRLAAARAITKAADGRYRAAGDGA